VPVRPSKSNTRESSILNQSRGEIPSLLPSRRGLKLASLNINKFTTHIDELRVFLTQNKIDILSIHETKLNETITDNIEWQRALEGSAST